MKYVALEKCPKISNRDGDFRILKRTMAAKKCMQFISNGEEWFFQLVCRHSYKRA